MKMRNTIQHIQKAKLADKNSKNWNVRIFIVFVDVIFSSYNTLGLFISYIVT